MGVGVVDILHLRSPAKYKVWEGDIIKAINNNAIKDRFVYLKTMESLNNSSSPTQLLIQRDEKELSVTVSLYDLPRVIQPR
jgi:S1-C subfamily serine protease